MVVVMVVCFQDNTDIVVYFALVCSNSVVGLLNWIGGKKVHQTNVGLILGYDEKLKTNTDEV